MASETPRVGVNNVALRTLALQSTSTSRGLGISSCELPGALPPRERSLEPNTCETINGCISEGHQLYWDSQCLTFGVSGVDTSRLNLTPEEFRDIVEDAFKVWEGVDCGGGKHPGLSVQGVGLVDASGGFFCEAEPRANLSVWSLVTQWERSARAPWYTSSMHNLKNGEVFDADVVLNSNKIYNDYEDTPADYPLVVGKIAVHEAGHFLGLAHSRDHDTVMAENYGMADLFARTIQQDDIDGICALYPPVDDLECTEPGYVAAALDEEACDEAAIAPDGKQSGGCSVAPSQATKSGLNWLAAFAAAVLLSARRRARFSRNSRGNNVEPRHWVRTSGKSSGWERRLRPSKQQREPAAPHAPSPPSP